MNIKLNKMKKQLTAEWLLNELLDMKAKHYDLSIIKLSYKYDADSDYEDITFLSEGLYDAETNNILEELIFMTDASEYEDEYEEGYPFKEGDDYWTIENGEVTWSCWDSVSEDLHDMKKVYFASEKLAIEFLKQLN
jgi:hypothetical protein